MADLLQMRRFFMEIVPFASLRPAPEVIAPAEWAFGHTPLALATADRSTVAVYLPTGGAVCLLLGKEQARNGEWFDPRSGEFVGTAALDATGRFVAPAADAGNAERPADWVLVVRDA